MLTASGLRNSPLLTPRLPAEAKFADANGGVTTTILNRAGEIESRQDAEGILPSFDRAAEKQFGHLDARRTRQCFTVHL